VARANVDCRGLRPRNDDVFIYGLAMTMYSSTALQRQVWSSVELALRYQFAQNAPIALH
jgi:hypothetical protein